MVDKAIREYEAAIDKNPNHVLAHMLLGVIYDSKKDFSQARKQYEKVLDINPDFAPAANNLAWLEAEHGGDIDRAFRLAQTARENVPDDPSVADTLGWVYYKKNILTKAIAYLEESREKLPEHPVIRYHLGMAYFRNGQLRSAEKELKEALTLSPDFDGADEAKKALESMGG